MRGARASRGGDPSRRMRMPPAAAYHVLLSVLHPAPDKLHVDFDAEAALEDYVGTFVDNLNGLHNFTLKTQWLHLLELDFLPKQVPDSTKWRRHFAVSEERLRLLLTPVEKRIGTHISEHATMNLVLYANPCQSAPLRIYTSDNKMVESAQPAFMSPRWGGVVIGNPSYEECRRELEDLVTPSRYTPPVAQVMGTFLAQLRPLLGFPKLSVIEGAFVDDLHAVGPRLWELDCLARIRTLEHLISAKLNLQSLSQLLGRISNIVINDEVAASIYSAVENIELADRLLKEGRIRRAYKVSLDAFVAAESAFNDPSLLALLYFPDDQKYAVYIPLFLPIMIPVLFSLKTLIAWFRTKTPKAKTD